MKEAVQLTRDINWNRAGLLMKIGIVGAFLNLTGDMLAGWGVGDESLAGMERLLSQYLVLSDRRIFWSAMLGFVGVPVSAVGHLGIYSLIKPYSSQYAKLYAVGIFGCLTFGGSGVHMSSLASVFFYRNMTAVAPETALAASLKFAGYFSLPPCIALLICWMIHAYAHIRALATGSSPFPRCCWVFSTPIGTLFFSISIIFGNYAMANAIAVGAFTLGNIWMLAGHLLMLDRVKEELQKLSA